MICFVLHFCRFQLFCCNLRQNGEKDTDGILGFLTQDIQKEVKRVKGSKNSRNYNFYVSLQNVYMNHLKNLCIIAD